MKNVKDNINNINAIFAEIFLTKVKMSQNKKSGYLITSWSSAGTWWPGAQIWSSGTSAGLLCSDVAHRPYRTCAI